MKNIPAPIIIAIIIFTIRELPNTYKETLINIRKSNRIKEKYGKIASLRTLLGLSASVKVKSANDIPVFMSQEEFIKNYEGPEAEKIEIENLINEELRRSEKIDPTAIVSESDVVEFHVSLGLDRDVFENKPDKELPNDILVQRVKYSASMITRKLYAYQFPIAFLCFVTCMNRWFKGFENLNF